MNAAGLIRLALMVYLFALAFMCCEDTAKATASHRPIPAEQWTPDAWGWTARGMVAEADWIAAVDHAAVAHILARRWKRKHEQYPAFRFVDAVRGYCAGLSARAAASNRQQWVRLLPMPGPTMEAPSGWPERASWKRYRVLWLRVLQRAQAFAHGKLPDPTHGRAIHWGSCDERLPDIHRARRAIERGDWVPLEVPGAVNCFYARAPRGGGRS